MDTFHSDDLPPELDELGMRMSTERPVASDRVLQSAMTRAQGAPRTKTSLLWRSSAPRTPRKTIALLVAAIAATGGMATAASANGLFGLGGLLSGGKIPILSSLLGSPAPATGNCSANGIIAVGAGALSNCSGSSSSAGGNNCSAAGGIAVGAGVLSNCSGGSNSGANCSSVGGIAVGAGVLSDCSGGSGGQANCTGVGGIAVSAAVLSDCSRGSAAVSGDAAAAQYEEPEAECDGLLNAKAKLLRDINALLVILPSFDQRIVDLNVRIDALDTNIKACVNLP